MITSGDLANVTLWVVLVLGVAAVLGSVFALVGAAVAPLFDRIDQQRAAKELLDRRRMGAVVLISERRRWP